MVAWTSKDGGHEGQGVRRFWKERHDLQMAWQEKGFLSANRVMAAIPRGDSHCLGR